MQAHQAKSVDVEWNEDIRKQQINEEEDLKKAKLFFFFFPLPRVMEGCSWKGP